MAIEIQEWPKVTVWREEKGFPRGGILKPGVLVVQDMNEAPDPCGDLSKAFSGSDSGSLGDNGKGQNGGGAGFQCLLSTFPAALEALPFYLLAGRASRCLWTLYSGLFWVWRETHRSVNLDPKTSLGGAGSFLSS